MMEIQSLFPTLVGITQANQATIDEIAQEVLMQKEALEAMLSRTWGDNVLTSFEKEKNLFVAVKLHALRSFVEKSIFEFVRTTRANANLVIDEAYTQSWVNVTRQFGFQERHNHERGSVGLPISGAYYFATNGQDGELAIFPTDMQAKFFGNYVIEPQVGKLVLFRSEVFHRVSPNLTQSDRISFSFNYTLTNATAT